MMRTIYIDSERKCHAHDDGTMAPVVTAFFDGKCDTFIEGYCYDDSEGYAAIYPRKDYAGLAIAQTQYEQDLAALEAAYREGVNSV